MAVNPIRFKLFSTGGPNSKSYRIYRDGNKIQVESCERPGQRNHECKTVSEAKRLIDNPHSICNF